MSEAFVRLRVVALSESLAKQYFKRCKSTTSWVRMPYRPATGSLPRRCTASPTMDGNTTPATPMPAVRRSSRQTPRLQGLRSRRPIPSRPRWRHLSSPEPRSHGPRTAERWAARLRPLPRATMNLRALTAERARRCPRGSSATPPPTMPRKTGQRGGDGGHSARQRSAPSLLVTLGAIDRNLLGSLSARHVDVFLSIELFAPLLTPGRGRRPRPPLFDPNGQRRTGFSRFWRPTA